MLNVKLNGAEYRTAFIRIKDLHAGFVLFNYGDFDLCLSLTMQEKLNGIERSPYETIINSIKTKVRPDKSVLDHTHLIGLFIYLNTESSLNFSVFDLNAIHNRERVIFVYRNTEQLEQLLKLSEPKIVDFFVPENIYTEIEKSLHTHNFHFHFIKEETDGD